MRQFLLIDESTKKKADETQARTNSEKEIKIHMTPRA